MGSDTAASAEPAADLAEAPALRHSPRRIQRLAELMDGSMWAESAGPGLGSTFRFSIRVPIAESAPSARRDFTGEQPALAGKRLLVVDDNATNRRVLALQAAK